MDLSIEAAAALVEEILLLPVLADLGAEASFVDALVLVPVLFFAGAFLATFSLTAFTGGLVVVFWEDAAVFLAEASLVLEATFLVAADFLAEAFALVLGADLVAAGLDFLAGEVVDLRGILLDW